MTVYDVAVTNKGRLVHIPMWTQGSSVELIPMQRIIYIVGSEIDSPEDGCEKTASFVKPTGICSEGETTFLTDTGAVAVKIISPTEPLADFLNHDSIWDSQQPTSQSSGSNLRYGRSILLL